MKYVQPQVPRSFKPESTYRQPAYALESGTVYSLSYPAIDVEMLKDCKPQKRSLVENIRPSSLPMSQETTFRLSFTGVGGDKAISCKPAYKNMLGTGPLSSMTTHRHDYPPKISEKPIQKRQTNNIFLSKAKMEGDFLLISTPYLPPPPSRWVNLIFSFF